jgi:dienelactone hydrolase
MRRGLLLGGGVPSESKTIQQLVRLYTDALEFLRKREMADPAKCALFGTSFGASLALAVASQDQKLAAVALAYPAPMRPEGVACLVSAPMLYVGGSADRRGERARAQVEKARSTPGASVETAIYPGVRRDFLARDLPAYDLTTAEKAWTQIIGFLRQRLMPPPPKPPAPPLRATPPAVTAPAPPVANRPAAPTPAPAPPSPALAPGGAAAH